MVDLDDINGFVIADIPGLIEGASQGIGLGFEFLRHIERTRVIIHIVDGASVEGRDPIEDIKTINAELASYDKSILERPWVIAANKMDAAGEQSTEIVERLKAEFEPQGVKVFPISAVSGQGVKELLYEVKRMLDECPQGVVTFESEYDPTVQMFDDEPYTIEINKDHEFVVEGPRIDKMLGYTNLESERGFLFFQKFLKAQGILKELQKMGIEDGDTVRMYGFAFEYYGED